MFIALMVEILNICYTCIIFFINGGRRLNAEGQEFFTSYDEAYDTFDAMELKEDLLKGIYAYGQLKNLFCFYFSVHNLCTVY